MRDYDYMVFLNSEVPFDSDRNPSVNPVYSYSPSEVAPYLVEGTNLVAVYINTFEDYVWGRDTTVVYSDPLGNSSGSSYVEVNYSMPPAVPYGVIEVRVVEDFGGEPSYTKDTDFSFPAEAESASSVFLHPVEKYSYITRAYADTGYPPGNLVFESPASRAVPSDIYVPLNVIDDTPGFTNYVRLQEASWNEVLPNSTVDYGFYIRGFVGYGEVFATRSESVDDAVDRLSVMLGSYVDASDIVIDNTTMSGVPSLWGPAVAEVRVWD